MVSIEGTELNQADESLLGRQSVGGLILFARNYQSKAQISALIQCVRRINPNILIAVDQEGGRVQRFREGFLALPALARLGALYLEDKSTGLAAAEECGWAMAAELVSLGVDFSFAPVLDVYTETSRVIGDRAFSPDPSQLSELALSYVKGMNSAGMAATGKHFPGHGTVDADSHVELPIDRRSLAEIAAHDLIPFSKLASSLGGIMPAHVLYPEVDSLCAGFSPFWLQEVLRAQLEFSGVIFSDDLTMDAAHSVGSIEARAELALLAGCDMVLVCNDGEAATCVADFLERNPERRDDASDRRLSMMARNTEVIDYQFDHSAKWSRAIQIIAALPA
jgi:beta-N-acetylhexosaminidase